VPEDKDTLAIRELDAAVGDWMLKGVKLDRDSARFIRAALAFFEKRAVFLGGDNYTTNAVCR
jgi:hypothetical protein